MSGSDSIFSDLSIHGGSEGSQDEIIRIKRAMKMAKARQASIGTTSQANQSELNRLRIICKSQVEDIEHLQQVIFDKDSKLKKVKGELKHAQEQTNALKESHRIEEIKGKATISGLKTALEKIENIIHQRHFILFQEGNRLLKLVSALERHTQHGFHIVASRTTVNLLSKIRQIVESIVVSIGEVTKETDSSQNKNKRDALGNGDRDYFEFSNNNKNNRSNSQSKGSHQNALSAASQHVASTDLEASLLEMVALLEDENRRLGETVEEAARRAAAAEKQSSALSLIPDYRVAVVKARSEVASLKEQLQQEQLTNATLREHIEITLQELDQTSNSVQRFQDKFHTLRQERDRLQAELRSEREANTDLTRDLESLQLAVRRASSDMPPLAARYGGGGMSGGIQDRYGVVQNVEESTRFYSQPGFPSESTNDFPPQTIPNLPPPPPPVSRPVYPAQRSTTTYPTMLQPSSRPPSPAVPPTSKPSLKPAAAQFPAAGPSSHHQPILTRQDNTRQQVDRPSSAQSLTRPASIGGGGGSRDGITTSSLPNLRGAAVTVGEDVWEQNKQRSLPGSPLSGSSHNSVASSISSTSMKVAERRAERDRTSKGAREADAVVSSVQSQLNDHLMSMVPSQPLPVPQPSSEPSRSQYVDARGASTTIQKTRSSQTDNGLNSTIPSLRKASRSVGVSTIVQRESRSEGKSNAEGERERLSDVRETGGSLDSDTGRAGTGAGRRDGRDGGGSSDENEGRYGDLMTPSMMEGEVEQDLLALDLEIGRLRARLETVALAKTQEIVAQVIDATTTHSA